MIKIRYVREHAGQTVVSRGIAKRTILRSGRRWGKTTWLENIGSYTAARRQKLVGWFVPNYKLMTPTYRRIHRMLQPVVERSSKIDSIIELSGGGSIEFWTLNDPDAGRSRYYDLVIIDEASLAPGLRDIWEQSIAPTLLDRDGAAIIAGTPKGVDPDNYFYLACTDKSLGWKEFHSPTSGNPNLSRESVDRLKGEYPPLVYQQEYLAEFVDWSGVAFFSQDSLLVGGNPVEWPASTDQVFAVIDTALKDSFEHDGTAVIYCARNKYGDPPLTVLDWEIIQIEGAMLENWLPGVHQRLDEFTQIIKAREGNAGCWIEDKGSGTILLQQALRHGITAFPIDSGLTSLGKEGRALNVSGHVYRGKVKISRFAFEKTINFRGNTRNHLLSQVCGFRIGTKTPHNMDLLDCFCYAAAISLGDSEGF